MSGEGIPTPEHSKEQLQLLDMVREFGFANDAQREEKFSHLLITLKDRRFLSQKAVENLGSIAVNELPKYIPAIREALEDYFLPYIPVPPYANIPSMHESANVRLNHTRNTPFGIDLATGKINFTYEYNGQTMKGDRKIVALLEEFENAGK